MFCSNCGKTIPPEAVECPHCGAYLGEDCFVGNTYTSSQMRVPVDKPDSVPAGSLCAYTRTDYMSYDNQPEDDVYSNTTYRPILTDQEDESLQDEEEYVPEDIPEEFPEDGQSVPEEDDFPGDGNPDAEEEPADEDQDPVDEQQSSEEPADIPDDEIPEEDDEEESVSPLPDIPKIAISPSVKRYMQEYEDRRKAREEAAARGSLWQRLSSRGKTQPDSSEEIEEEPAEDIPGMEEDDFPMEQEPGYPDPADDESDGLIDEDVPVETDEEATADLTDYADDPSEEFADNAEETYDTVYDDEASYDEEESVSEKKPFKFDLSLLKNRRVQIVIGALLAVVILVLGIRWITYVASSLGVKLTGVTRSTYSDGIKLITDYTSEEYRGKLIETGSVNETYARQLMAEDMISLNALLPDQPEENDELFVTTLTIIHNAAQNTILADAAAAREGTTEARAAASVQEWSLINGAVTSLSNATNVTQLSAIATDIQSVLAPSPSPTAIVPAEPVVTPTPAPVTLKEGMNDNAAVEKAQSRLIELGYLTGKADGDFGPKTTAAVKSFQKALGLEETGIIDEALQQALYADDAPKAEPAA